MRLKRSLQTAAALVAYTMPCFVAAQDTTTPSQGAVEAVYLPERTQLEAGFMVPDCPPQPRWGQRWHWRSGGCKQRWQQAFLGFPEEFEEPTLGTFLHAHHSAMIASGEAARMVLHQYDFVEGSSELNVRGQDQLARITLLMRANFFPIVIERTPDMPGLDESRRLLVMSELSRGPFPVPGERVVIGPPLANGLTGREAELIHENFLQHTRARGAGGGSIGGTVGQGFGATGRTPAGTTP